VSPISRLLRAAALIVPVAAAAPGCFSSELNGADVDAIGQVDDSAFVRFLTADGFWVGLLVMSDTQHSLLCTDFESAEWIKRVMEANTMLIQLYSKDGNGWLGDFGSDVSGGDLRLASGIVWTDLLLGEEGRETAFTREEALFPCLAESLSSSNRDAVVPYDHDVQVHLSWWSEGIDLRGTFTGSQAAGYIRAVDCGPLEVEFNVEDAIQDYADGC